MSDFHFIRPLWLLALLPCALIWFKAWRQSASLGTLAKIVDAQLLKHLLVDARAQQTFRPIHALGITWLLAALAPRGAELETGARTPLQTHRPDSSSSFASAQPCWQPMCSPHASNAHATN